MDESKNYPLYCEQTALYVEFGQFFGQFPRSDILSRVSFLPETLSLPRLSVPTSQLGKENSNGNNRLLTQNYTYKIWQYEWIKINRRKYFTQL